MSGLPLIDEVLSLGTEGLPSLALHIFHYQSKNNLIYSDYIKALKIAPEEINSFEKIPFLPIDFFKTHSVKTGEFQTQKTFTSSGTTGNTTSQHHVKDLRNYQRSFTVSFEQKYGSISNYCIAALLPSYLEREGSSLVYMAEKMIAESLQSGSDFFLHNHQVLADKLEENEKLGIKTLLLGVTYALLDFAEQYPMSLKNTIVMETGGMKGRRQEITRMEVHQFLQKAFAIDRIHSEYGMTEMLTQAYSSENGLFEPPVWMRVLVRDTSDPLSSGLSGRGGLNVIDLANLDSCCFIATQDLGVVHENGDFEVTGRFDHSDIRGCSLMVV